MQILLTAIGDPKINSAAGSSLWQLVFISFAIVLVLFQIVRGWRLGLMRQLVRLGALISAYAAAFFGGKLLVPMVRPLIKAPDMAIAIIGSVLLAIAVYVILTGIGAILFKSTGQQHSRIVRFLYGLTGAVIGIFFGAFLVWLIVVGVRSIGTVADAHVREQAKAPAIGPVDRNLHTIDVRRRLLSDSSEEQASLMTSLARLKNSLEMGTVGDFVKKSDVIPSKTYETLGKLGQIVSNPENAERFLSFPGAQELSEHPRIVALREDSYIQELIAQGRFFDLLQDQRLIDALNDPTLIEQIKKFDLSRAVDYAIARP